MVAEGLRTYIYGAASLDLLMPWSSLDAIIRYPSDLERIWHLLQAIEPWGRFNRSRWELMAVEYGGRPEQLQKHLPIFGLRDPEVATCFPPTTWTEMQFDLCKKLETRCAPFGKEASSIFRTLKADDAALRFDDLERYARAEVVSLEFNRANPASVVKQGRRLLDAWPQTAPDRRGLRVAWGLLLIGHGTRAVMPNCCALCMARPLPGSTHCAAHSQAAGSHGHGGYQHGRRLRAFLEARGQWPVLHQALLESVRIGESYRHLELFGEVTCCEYEVLGEIHDALQYSPLIRCMIDTGDMSLPALREQLRNVLDPEERLDITWPWKIVIAECLERGNVSWQEGDVAPGGRTFNLKRHSQGSPRARLPTLVIT